jgi:HSP20 family protein
MDWKKIAPWNWFKEEQTRASHRSASIDTPSDPLRSLRSEMERLFDQTFSSHFPTAASGSAPPLRPNVDISEGKKAYTVRAELPGVQLDDVSIELEGHTLVIRAEKRQESEEEDEGYHCVERSYGMVQRVLSLPDDADPEAVDAKFKNGVLELRIPKHAARASQTRRIEIERG